MIKFAKELSNLAEEVNLLRTEIFGAVIAANNVQESMSKLKYDDFKKQLQKVKMLSDDITRSAEREDKATN